MKLFITLLLTSSCFAESLTFTNSDGNVVSGEIRRVEPDGIVLMNPEFLKKFRFDEIPEDIGKKYGYDPAKATEFQRQLDETTKASRLAAQQYEENKTRARELAKNATEQTFWAIENFQNGMIAHPSFFHGGGIIGDSAASVGGGGYSMFIEPTAHPLPEWVYVEGVRDFGMGDKIKIKAYRDGVIKRGNQTLQRWVSVGDIAAK